MSAQIRIAILHYHLRRGGVTKVIEHARNSLPADKYRICAVVGEAPNPDTAIDAAVVPGLEYGRRANESKKLLEDVRKAARKALDGPPDIWHVHNHSLGKNLAMPALVNELADAGERILLQPHDFAEDCRPANYRLLKEGLGPVRFSNLYPCSERIHYALLNSRDRQVLQTAGAPENWIHPLPNPAPAFSPGKSGAGKPSRLPRDNLILYPTRAIRRKNIGELLLWAALAEADEWFGVTLAPENPDENPLYRRWTKLARDLSLPISFELGAEYALEELFEFSSAAITTSLAEGYGMAFIEPWMAGCPVVGRNLPEVTGEFDAAGIELKHCYDRLEIPVEWLGRKKIFQRLRSIRSEMLAQYGLDASDSDLEATLAAAIRSDRIDFGTLDEDMQIEVVRRLAESRRAQTEIAARLPVEKARSCVDRNREAISRDLNLDRYGERLERIYRKLMNASAAEISQLDPDRVLAQFIRPERFRPLLAG